MALLWAFVPATSGNIGKIDFRAYWSASYLLAQGEDFADDANLMAVQQGRTGWDADFPMKTWNPPWILAWLWPFTQVTFGRAVTLWLLTNIVLLFTAVLLSWRFYGEGLRHGRRFWLPMVLALFNPFVIVALLFGQMNILVLGGMALFVALYGSGRDGASGVALALTMVKPHLVYVTLPILFLMALSERRWKMVAGFGVTLGVSIGFVFLLYPPFLGSYINSTAGGNLLAYETSTLSTYLSLVTGLGWLRLMGVVVVPLVMGVWWRWRDGLSLVGWVNVTVLLSVITMPFGWSYDFVVLLLPMTTIIYGLVTRPVSPIVLGLLFFGSMGVAYYQRVATPSELYYFWFPVAMAGLYSWVVWSSGRQGRPLEDLVGL